MICLALPRFGFRSSSQLSQAASLSTDIRLKAERIFKGVDRPGEMEVSLVKDLTLTLRGGDCVGLTGDSLLAKTMLLQILHGQVSLDAGALWLPVGGHWVNIARLSRSQLQMVYHQSIGYLGQVLPTTPRTTAFEMVLDPLLSQGISRHHALEMASSMLTQVLLPQRLWRVSPVQLSKAEQQRVNIARTFAVEYPIYLLNAPMTHLAEGDRQPLLVLIDQRKASGSAFVGIFQDMELQQRVCTNLLSC